MSSATHFPQQMEFDGQNGPVAYLAILGSGPTVQLGLGLGRPLQVALA